MKKLLFILLASTTIAAKAQTANTAITEHDPTIRVKDSTIKANIIDPAEQSAGDEAPDWTVLTQTITRTYDALTADRTITKARIYFYFSKDWPTFCDGIVHYTDKYELSNDYKLLNKNAGMILKNSDDKAQLTEALRWSKATLDSDPNNEKFKATCQGISDKLAGK